MNACVGTNISYTNSYAIP